MSVRGESLIDRLSADVGRLRRRIENDEYALLLVERIASAVEILDGMFRPTAADITRENHLHSLDQELAVECALEDVDERQKHLRRLLGIPDAKLPSRERIRQLVEEMGPA